MLKDQLYTVKSSKKDDSRLEYIIQINPEHAIYSGHFPGFPVTPGVVELEIIKELAEGELGKKLRLDTIRNCKFTQILDPTKVGDLDVSITLTSEDSSAKVEAEIKDGNGKYLVLKSTYSVVGA